MFLSFSFQTHGMSNDDPTERARGGRGLFGIFSKKSGGSKTKVNPSLSEDVSQSASAASADIPQSSSASASAASVFDTSKEPQRRSALQREKRDEAATPVSHVVPVSPFEYITKILDLELSFSKKGPHIYSHNFDRVSICEYQDKEARSRKLWVLECAESCLIVLRETVLFFKIGFSNATFDETANENPREYDDQLSSFITKPVKEELKYIFGDNNYLKFFEQIIRLSKYTNLKNYRERIDNPSGPSTKSTWIHFLFSNPSQRDSSSNVYFASGAKSERESLSHVITYCMGIFELWERKEDSPPSTSQGTLVALSSLPSRVRPPTNGFDSSMSVILRDRDLNRGISYLGGDLTPSKLTPDVFESPARMFNSSLRLSLHGDSTS